MTSAFAWGLTVSIAATGRVEPKEVNKAKMAKIFSFIGLMFKVVFGIDRSVSQDGDKDTAIAEINPDFRSALFAKLSLWERKSPSLLRHSPDFLEMQLNGAIGILCLNQNRIKVLCLNIVQT
jgi:hypothetical protein